MNTRYVKLFFLFLFFLSFFGTMASLFYSEIMHFKPCALCWYQRIFLYPIPIILLIGLIKKDLNSIFYVVFLSAIGLIIAIYHYIIQLTQSKSVVCEIGANSCAKIEVEYLGFITLPLMSSLCFALIFGIGLKLIIKSKKLKQNQHLYF